MLLRAFTQWQIQHVKAKQEVCAQNQNAVKIKPLNPKESELLQFVLQFEEIMVFLF